MAITEDAALKRSCCETWTNPIARLLLGERLHPGGHRTTALTLESLGLERGATVLDLGCGYGATVATLTERGYVPIGLDLAPDAATAASEHGSVIMGDAELPPIGSGALDGIMMECVLSLLPNKRGALRHAHRALRQAGRLAVSDVTLERPLPAPLQRFATWSACVEGALSAAGYVSLLDEVGFTNIETINLDEELVGLIDQARRRISLAEIALTVQGVDLPSLGLDRDLLEQVRSVAAQATEVVREGGAGYRLFHATKEEL